MATLPDPDRPVYTQQPRHARALGCGRQLRRWRRVGPWRVNRHVSGRVSAFVVAPTPASCRAARLGGRRDQPLHLRRSARPPGRLRPDPRLQRTIRSLPPGPRRQPPPQQRLLHARHHPHQPRPSHRRLPRQTTPERQDQEGSDLLDIGDSRTTATRSGAATERRLLLRFPQLTKQKPPWWGRLGDRGEWGAALGRLF